MAAADRLRGASTPQPLFFARVPRTRSLRHRIGAAVQKAWRDYWRRRAARATLAVLHALDDRTLKDIGLHRTEIESVVHGTCGERRLCICH
jgi:uncharacterized protein YjiS (DUF1127 family)